MDMIDYLTLAIFFGLGCFVGARVTAAINRAVFKTLLEELGIGSKQLIELAKKNGMEVPGLVQPHADQGEEVLEVINIKLEQHNGHIYAFRKDNDAFLGQGETRETLVERLGETLRKCRLVITPEDGAGLIGENTSYEYDRKSKEIKQTKL